MEIKEFESKIKPFFWVKHSDSYSVCLNVGEFKDEIFETRSDEGFEGGGYDWCSLACVFLNEKTPALKELINFDPEGSMFCAYSKDKEALQKFIVAFKEASENEELIQDLFSRAELD
ncbi:immunity 51 family protein [Tenacibaculum finnmarkense genomovar ulcerans]|uniref:immunity 51 family protein n=1 Tax=Tenacibaculum finnmarkense TaxID=2781243 RepID=UPI001E46D6B9|nr:immunity 51 family protein [Tenacibaculum finnmarkense]MCD8454589.1 immunity 51 family protein [Tenacibaculum finnmarkense genomovar ulcerans]